MNAGYIIGMKDILWGEVFVHDSRRQWRVLKTKRVTNFMERDLIQVTIKPVFVLIEMYVACNVAAIGWWIEPVDQNAALPVKGPAVSVIPSSKPDDNIGRSRPCDFSECEWGHVAPSVHCILNGSASGDAIEISGDIVKTIREVRSVPLR